MMGVKGITSNCTVSGYLHSTEKFSWVRRVSGDALLPDRGVVG
jgi:hypothetical protein